MPVFGPWRSDAAIYTSNEAPTVRGTTEVDSTNDGGVGALAGSASITLDSLSGTVSVGVGEQFPSGFTTVFQAFEGFMVWDLAPLLTPVDPAVAYPPQVPFDDPDTSRPDWLGNLPPFDPYLGVEFADDHGTLADDQDLTLGLFGLALFPGAGADPPTAAVWIADGSVLSGSGSLWTAASVPLDSVGAVVAAAAWKHTGIPAVPEPPFGILTFVAPPMPVPFSALRASRYLPLALTTESPSFTPVAWGGGFSAALSGVQVPYRNPNYRLIFANAPPQRQFPRDDGLGISTRRSWPPVTSKQFGLRRGASGTYQ